MPYREKKVFSGKMLEVEVYPISIREKKQSRALKNKLSAPKQRNLNDKNARKYFVRLANTNFRAYTDFVVHLSYSNEHLPANDEEAKKDMTNYIRRVKNYIKKNNLPPLKYMAVIELGKKNKRPHHHIIMSGDVDRDTLEKLWGKGWANADRLQEDEDGFEKLAKYMTKDPQGKKRWIQSKNLKPPKIKVNDNKFRSRKQIDELARCQGDRAYFEKLYPNYVLNEWKASINDYNSGTYVYIKLRKLE